MKNLWVLVLAVSIVSCVTSNGVNQKRRYIDPTGVKTLDDSSDLPGPAPTMAERAGVEVLKSRIAVLEGELEETKVLSQREIATLTEQVKVLSDENLKLKNDLEIASKTRVTEDTRKAAGLLWRAAAQDLSAGHYSDALPLLKQLIDRYPEDPHAYYAHTATAMVLYAQKKYAASAGGFAFVTQKFPNESGVQMAWYGQGACLYKMLKGSESMLFFKQTANRFGNTPEGRHAGQIAIKKAQPSGDLFLAFPNWLKDAAN